LSRLVRHIVIPSLVPLIFFVIALTPVEVMGCLTRGLLAITVSLISGISALCMAIIGLKLRVQNDPNASWWMMSTLVLTVPVIALLVLA